MEEKYESVECRCEHYKWEYINSIVCSGCRFASYTHIIFPNRKAKVAYRKRYCETKCEECPIYMAIAGEYDEQT